LKLEVDTRDYWGGGNLYYEASYEPITCRILDDQLRAGETFWDVGANIGVYSLLAAHRFRSCRVLAFEPSPLVLERLWRNKHLNNVQNLIIVPVALCNQVGEIEFFLNEKDGNQMMGSFRPHASDTRSVRVRAWPGDRLGEVHPDLLEDRWLSPNLVKIDGEGAELLVLRGLQRTLRESRPRLVIELHPEFLGDMGSSLTMVAGFLRESGYRARYFRPDGQEMAEEVAVSVTHHHPLAVAEPFS
jgi:FkbM family methyltransferase